MLEHADYSIIEANDRFVLIDVDDDAHLRVPDDAGDVIHRLDAQFAGGLRGRKVFCRKADGCFDELVHYFGRFTRQGHCSSDQSRFLETFCR
ncbi:hypothetical protein GCM10011348_04690 [Marinobacterium nitratireducens]|uniref:Uncharacterized protein n=1 Tax=Marinobacterium nitratireducens TaxID=518897 RepID=A0A917Z988_9GAMM|nr:hypothetical protein [Marinobacterium nitratireducens]GGO76748.1 hypothetical protein GCM10011348_04690 [Marinobacterium nitratireducens]